MPGFPSENKANVLDFNHTRFGSLLVVVVSALIVRVSGYDVESIIAATANDP
jgi:hypothetical protein